MTPEQARTSLVRAIPDLNIEKIAKANPSAEHNANEELNAISTKVSEFVAKYASSKN